MAAPDLVDRLEERAGRAPVRIRGRNVALLGVRTIRRCIDVRVTGLAAEMTYYALLSAIPLLSAVGSSLGLLRYVLGREQILSLEDAIVSGVRELLSPEVSEDIVVPLVQDLLAQERAGVAIGSLLLSLWLGGRIFRAAIRALDDAYAVAERRSLPQQWGLSLGFALGAVVTITVVLALVVIGPLLGGARWLAGETGTSSTFDVLWTFGRWPVVLLVAVAFLAWLYRSGPNVANTWRQCLPGAALASVTLILVATGFRLYLQVAGPGGPDVDTSDEAVVAAGQLVGAVLAGVLLVWLSSIAVLLGGVTNAELARLDAAPGAAPRVSPAPSVQREAVAGEDPRPS